MSHLPAVVMAIDVGFFIGLMIEACISGGPSTTSRHRYLWLVPVTLLVFNIVGFSAL